jgi:hypothetical protein
MTARIAAALAAGIMCACGLAAAARASERLSPSGGLSATLGSLGTAGRESCRRAIDDLPLERMQPQSRQLIEPFRTSTTLHRRLPVETLRCDRALVEFVLQKPEALVDVWRVLGISRVSLDPAGPGAWRLADGYGTTGLVRLLHQERGPGGGLLVFHGQGGYSGPLAPRELTGACLLVVRHAPAAGGGGEPAWRIEIEAFLAVDGLGLEIVTRTLKPLIIHSAAANVHEISLFVSQFARAAARNPAGVARLAERMPCTDPADRRMLVAVASGRSGTPPVRLTADTGADEVHEELAARWLPSESLDATRR